MQLLTINVVHKHVPMAMNSMKSFRNSLANFVSSFLFFHSFSVSSIFGQIICLYSKYIIFTRARSSSEHK